MAAIQSFKELQLSGGTDWVILSKFVQGQQTSLIVLFEGN